MQLLVRNFCKTRKESQYLTLFILVNSKGVWAALEHSRKSTSGITISFTSLPPPPPPFPFPSFFAPPPPPSSLWLFVVCFISLWWGWNLQSHARRQASSTELQYPMPWILPVGSTSSVNCFFFPVPVPFTALPGPVHSLEPQYNAEKKREPAAKFSPLLVDGVGKLLVSHCRPWCLL